MIIIIPIGLIIACIRCAVRAAQECHQRRVARREAQDHQQGCAAQDCDQDPQSDHIQSLRRHNKESRGSEGARMGTLTLLLIVEVAAKQTRLYIDL